MKRTRILFLFRSRSDKHHIIELLREPRLNAMSLRFLNESTSQPAVLGNGSWVNSSLKRKPVPIRSLMFKHGETSAIEQDITCLISGTCQLLLQYSAIFFPFMGVHHQAGRAVIWSGTVPHKSSQIFLADARRLEDCMRKVLLQFVDTSRENRAQPLGQSLFIFVVWG